MSNDILVQNEDDVFHITLNRAEQGNGVTDVMAADLIVQLDRASTSSRVVLLRGAGDDFCIGRATMGQATPAVRPEALQRRRQTEIIFDCYDAFRKCRIPIVSLVQGRSFGFGCAIASLSDITIAADSARFQIPEMKHNIMPTMVMSAMIDRVPRKALSYLVHSTAAIDAYRALVFGIISEIVPATQLDDAGRSICDAIVRVPAIATESVKDYLRTAVGMDCAGAVDYARNLHATINSSSEMKKYKDMTAGFS